MGPRVARGAPLRARGIAPQFPRASRRRHHRSEGSGDARAQSRSHARVGTRERRGPTLVHPRVHQRRQLSVHLRGSRGGGRGGGAGARATAEARSGMRSRMVRRRGVPPPPRRAPRAALVRRRTSGHERREGSALLAAALAAGGRAGVDGPDGGCAGRFADNQRWAHPHRTFPSVDDDHAAESGTGAWSVGAVAGALRHVLDEDAALPEDAGAFEGEEDEEDGGGERARARAFPSLRGWAPRRSPVPVARDVLAGAAGTRGTSRSSPPNSTARSRGTWARRAARRRSSRVGRRGSGGRAVAAATLRSRTWD